MADINYTRDPSNTVMDTQKVTLSFIFPTGSYNKKYGVLEGSNYVWQNLPSNDKLEVTKNGQYKVKCDYTKDDVVPFDVVQIFKYYGNNVIYYDESGNYKWTDTTPRRPSDGFVVGELVKVRPDLIGYTISNTSYYWGSGLLLCDDDDRGPSGANTHKRFTGGSGIATKTITGEYTSADIIVSNIDINPPEKPIIIFNANKENDEYAPGYFYIDDIGSKKITRNVVIDGVTVSADTTPININGVMYNKCNKNVNTTGTHNIAVTYTKTSNSMTSTTSMSINVDADPLPTPVILINDSQGVQAIQPFIAKPNTTKKYRVDITLNGSVYIANDEINLPEPNGNIDYSVTYLYGDEITNGGLNTLNVKFTKLLNNLVSTKIVTFTINNERPAPPIITGVSEGNIGVSFTPNSIARPGEEVAAYINDKPFILNTKVAVDGIYKLEVIAKNLKSGRSNSTIVNFTVDTLPPGIPEVTGVVEADFRKTYDILVKKVTDQTYVTKIDNIVVPYTEKNISGVIYLSIPYNKKGSHSFEVITTKTKNGLSSFRKINNFTVIDNDYGSGMIKVTPLSGETPNVNVDIKYLNKEYNESTFVIDNKRLFFQRPFRLFDNKTVSARETNDRLNKDEPSKEANSGKDIVNITHIDKSFPPVPIITGIIAGNKYAVASANVSNISSLYDYVIELDGRDYVLGTPISTIGKHMIVVTCKKRTNYNTSSSSVMFEIIQTISIDKPTLFFSPEKTPTDKVTVNIKYSRKSIKNEYKIQDGAWIIYTKPFEVNNNCTVFARSFSETYEVVENNIVISNIDTLPPDIPEIRGIDTTDYIQTIAFPSVFCKRNHVYNMILDGMDYVVGTPITNYTPSIKKHKLQVFSKKLSNNMISSNTVEFTIDTIPPKVPSIVNGGYLNNYFDKKFVIKLAMIEPGVTYTATLNGRSFDIMNPNNQFIKNPSDDSYILIVTATKKSNGLKNTRCYYFEINNNPINDIKNKRIVFKPLIRDNRVIRSPGELSVDYKTGHLYLTSDKLDIDGHYRLNNITEDIENLMNERILNIAEKDIDFFRTKLRYITECHKYITYRNTALEKDNIDIKKTFNDLSIELSKLELVIKKNEDIIILCENSSGLLDGKFSDILDRIKTLKASLLNKKELAIGKLDIHYSNGSDIAKSNHHELIIEELMALKVSRVQFDDFKEKENAKLSNVKEIIKNL